MMTVSIDELNKAHALMDRMMSYVETHEPSIDVLPVMLAALLVATSAGKYAGTDIDSMHVLLDYVWTHSELKEPPRAGD